MPQSRPSSSSTPTQPKCLRESTVIASGIGVPLATSGNRSPVSSVSVVPPFDLPFPFTLYDQTFTTFRVGANGTFQLGSISTRADNAPLVIGHRGGAKRARLELTPIKVQE